MCAVIIFFNDTILETFGRCDFILKISKVIKASNSQESFVSLRKKIKAGFNRENGKLLLSILF
jgi:hypothetical protein